MCHGMNVLHGYCHDAPPAVIFLQHHLPPYARFAHFEIAFQELEV